MGGKAKVFMSKDDRIVLMTPGGGGYGPDPCELDEVKVKEELRLFGNRRR
jgi:N-methylhydantoinase B/oxoprolinase/acetone carboxylase alpha subunit